MSKRQRFLVRPWQTFILVKPGYGCLCILNEASAIIVCEVDVVIDLNMKGRRHGGHLLRVSSLNAPVVMQSFVQEASLEYSSLRKRRVCFLIGSKNKPLR